METFNMGFRYKEGLRVGYDILFPNNCGGKIRLSNVSASDKARIIREIKQLGHDRKDISVEKV